jgi:two-component system phosphate regulon sensor histidine kinase PhoR
MSNALKYSPDGGTVRVRVAQPAGGEADLAVSDEGIEIAPDERAELFQPFSRVEPAQHAAHLGTGRHIGRHRPAR